MPVFKLIAIPSNGSPRQATPPIFKTITNQSFGICEPSISDFRGLEALRPTKRRPGLCSRTAPTQPYYERRVCSPQHPPCFRRCRRGDLHHLVDSALTMPSQCRESRNRHPFAPVFRHFMISHPCLSRFPPSLPHPIGHNAVERQRATINVKAVASTTPNKHRQNIPFRLAPPE